MSGIRRPKLWAPSPETYAKTAVATIGVTNNTFGYLFHAIQVTIIHKYSGTSLSIKDIPSYKENLYIEDTVADPNTAFTVPFNLCNKKTSVLWTITEIPTSSFREASLYVSVLIIFNIISFL